MNEFNFLISTFGTLFSAFIILVGAIYFTTLMFLLITIFAVLVQFLFFKLGDNIERLMEAELK